MNPLTDQPLVSAVIPTRNRPELVCRAVRSALNQTYKNIEVVVVVDGPDRATIAALEALSEPRVKVVALSESVGGSEARNTGVRESKGKWIALLDDDDEWLEDKIRRQEERSRQVNANDVIIASRVIERGSRADRVLPLRLFEEGEEVCEYLFCPRGFSLGEGFLQTSTFFINRDLLLRVPLVKGLKRGQEYTWLLMATKDARARLLVMPEALAVFNIDSSPDRIGKRPAWRDLLAWIQNHDRYFTKRAYAYYLAGGCVMDAITSKESTSTILALLRECVLKGQPDAKCLSFFLYRWLFRPSVLKMRSIASRGAAR